MKKLSKRLKNERISAQVARIFNVFFLIFYINLMAYLISMTKHHQTDDWQIINNMRLFFEKSKKRRHSLRQLHFGPVNVFNFKLFD